MLLAERPHPFSQFIQSQQILLIGGQQPLHASVHPCLLSHQMLLALLRRVRFFGRFQPPGELGLQQRWILQ